MNDARKQKLAITGAAVLVLGAGVYLWPGDRSDPLDTLEPNQRVPVVRTVVDSSTPERIRRPPTLEPPAPPKRPDRAAVDRQDDTRGPRRSVDAEKHRRKDPPKHAA